MFIDASALVAIIASEADGSDLRQKMRVTKHRHVSGVVICETVLALMRLKGRSRAETLAEVNRFVALNAITCIDIDRDMSELALELFERFGKGNHAARLNMGDCYAFACAKKLKQPLLFKGEDFSKTDVLKA